LSSDRQTELGVRLTSWSTSSTWARTHYLFERGSGGSCWRNGSECEEFSSVLISLIRPIRVQMSSHTIPHSFIKKAPSLSTRSKRGW